MSLGTFVPRVGLTCPRAWSLSNIANLADCLPFGIIETKTAEARASER